jgi:putative ABC transport system permease protein
LKPEIFFQPMTDWHLYGSFKDGVEAGGFIEYVRLFSIIGALVLLIACINFMNLSTARSEKRAREVGVRKAVGSRRQDLILQFLIESLVITIAAAGFALLLVQLTLSPFNLLTACAIAIPWSSALFWAIMAVYVLATGLLAGSRPAFYLSSFQPVKVLKGTIGAGRSAALPRKILVVLQFSCSIALIISTILIYQQIQYAKDRPTGYNADRLVMTDGSGDLDRNYPALKDELLKSGMVESITKSSSFVIGLWNWTIIEDWKGRLPDESLMMGNVTIADDYFPTMGMQLAAGRNFSGNYASDTSYVILNETAVKRMRLKDPINQVITWRQTPHTIIGVVKDALMQSPFSRPDATIFDYNPAKATNISYRLTRNADVHTAIARLETIFNKYNLSYPFLYHFVDESYAAKFHLETLVGRLAALFATLAIFISCLGLFGLAAYMAEQRMREIGIRKVLGATVSQLWLLLSKDFIALVLIGCVVASPVAYYFLHGWLQHYYYRITIGPGVFIVAAAMALLITVMTISFQAVRAAVSNPVKSLRTE